MDPMSITCLLLGLAGLAVSCMVFWKTNGLKAELTAQRQILFPS